MAAVGVAVFLGTIDGSIVNIALPTIVHDFDTSFGTVQWVVLSYLLTQATLVLGIGRLGDLAGRKPMFVAGFVVFVVASVLAGLSPGIEWLILFRIIQGFGSALIFSMQLALITESFPTAERGRAFGFTGTIVSTGIISGPIIGGLIIDAVDWRWIFYVNVPIGIIGILVAVRYIPHTKPGGAEPFDFLGGSLFFVGLLTLLLGLTTGQDKGFGDPGVVFLYVAAAISLTAFVMVENRAQHPMLDLHMFRKSDFSVSLFAKFATFTTMAGIAIIFPFYLTEVLGLTALSVGFAMAALPLAMGSLAPLAGAWSDRNGVRPVSMVGMILLLTAFVMGRLIIDAETAIWAFVGITFLIGVGFGAFHTPNDSSVMGAVPREQLGVASSLITITRITGWMTGTAVMGTIWAVRTSSYAGGDAAEDAPAAAQASGLSDVLLVSLVVIAVVVVVAWWAWRGRWTE